MGPKNFRHTNTHTSLKNQHVFRETTEKIRVVVLSIVHPVYPPATITMTIMILPGSVCGYRSLSRPRTHGRFADRPPTNVQTVGKSNDNDIFPKIHVRKIVDERFR